MKKQNKAFTLVELIVVIVVLAILSVIAFLSYNNYTKYARDSKRISNVATIALGFDMAIAKNTGINYYSTSDDPNIILSGSTLRMTGYYGDISDKLLISLGVSGEDLSINDGFQNYKYSYYPQNFKYQVMGLLEDKPISGRIFDFDNAYAASQSGGYVYIKGNFVSTGGITGLIPDNLAWATASGDPKVIDGSGEVYSIGNYTDIDPLASLPVGNVSGYAWSEGFGYIDFSYVSINNVSFSGTIWSEGVGWSNFNSNSPNTLTLGWNSGVRKFNGYIWSESLGWINFNADSTNRVYIGADGYWKGKAWSESLGWIDFNSGSVH